MARSPTERHIVLPTPEAGFFPLHLKIECGLEQKQINYLLGENDLELIWAPSSVHVAIRNFQAVMMFSKPLLQSQAIEDLEQVHKEHPKNINTLANLIYMYKHSNESPHIQEYCTKLEESKTDTLEKARCLLEQAYVLICDTHSEAKETALKKVKDVEVILHQRKRETVGRKARQIEDVNPVVDELKRSLTAMPEICVEDTKKERQLSIQLFKEGLEQLEKLKSDDDSSVDPNEILVWKHYFGKAFNRIGGSPLLFSKTGEKKQDLRKAIDMFCDVITGLATDESTDQSIKTCKARSYAYLGHLIMTKKKIVCGVKDAIPDCMTKEELMDIWEDPLKALKKAEQLSSNDRVVLNRYGLTLKSDEQFEEAATYFAKSLELCSEFNWFAYCCRGQLYIEMYVSKINELEKSRKGSTRSKSGQAVGDVEKCRSFLHKAMEDVEKCLSYRTTTSALTDLAKINYYLGTDPFKVKSLKDHVIDKTKITIAILHLQEALQHHECEYHSRTYSLLGKCLFSVGNKKDAIKYMKKALAYEPPSVKDPVDFQNVCQFLLSRYQLEKNESFSKKIFVLTEIWIMLLEAARKYKNRLRYQLIGVTNNYPHEIIDLLQEVNRQKIKSAGSVESKIIQKICINALKRHNGERVKIRAKGLSISEPVLEDESDITANETYDIPAPNEKSMFAKKKYDFIISHSKEIANWVQYGLLEQLEGDSQGSPLKGWFRRRKCDFDTVKSEEENFDIALRETRKVIIVVTDCYLNNERYMKECYRIVRFQNEQGDKMTDNRNDGFIIPVVRDTERVPECLNFLQPLYFSDPPYDFRKLLHVLCEPVFSTREESSVSEKLCEETRDETLREDSTEDKVDEEQVSANIDMVTSENDDSVDPASEHDSSGDETPPLETDKGNSEATDHHEQSTTEATEMENRNPDITTQQENTIANLDHSKTGAVDNTSKQACPSVSELPTSGIRNKDPGTS